jgi:hypothetical protein
MGARPLSRLAGEQLVQKLVQQMGVGIQLLQQMDPDSSTRLRLWTAVYGLAERLTTMAPVTPVLRSPDEVAHAAQTWNTTCAALLAEVAAYHATRDEEVHA